MRSISSRGPIVLTYVLFWVREGILHFQKSIGFLKIFEPRKCFIVTDGRVGRMDGHQKGPLIFFILRYIKHYTHIYLYIYKKNVLANFLWV